MLYIRYTQWRTYQYYWGRRSLVWPLYADFGFLSGFIALTVHAAALSPSVDSVLSFPSLMYLLCVLLLRKRKPQKMKKRKKKKRNEWRKFGLMLSASRLFCCCRLLCCVALVCPTSTWTLEIKELLMYITVLRGFCPNTCIGRCRELLW
jgi:hypothetical protein